MQRDHNGRYGRCPTSLESNESVRAEATSATQDANHNGSLPPEGGDAPTLAPDTLQRRFDRLTTNGEPNAPIRGSRSHTIGSQ